MAERLTEAEQHGERMRNLGHEYHGGYTLEQSRMDRIYRNIDMNFSDENSREEYQRWLKDMKEFIEKLKAMPSFDFDRE